MQKKTFLGDVRRILQGAVQFAPNQLTKHDFFLKLLLLRLHLKPNKIGCPEPEDVFLRAGVPLPRPYSGYMTRGLRKILCGSSVHTHSRGV